MSLCGNIKIEVTPGSVVMFHFFDRLEILTELKVPIKSCYQFDEVDWTFSLATNGALTLIPVHRLLLVRWRTHHFQAFLLPTTTSNSSNGASLLKELTDVLPYAILLPTTSGTRPAGSAHGSSACHPSCARFSPRQYANAQRSSTNLFSFLEELTTKVIKLPRRAHTFQKNKPSTVCKHNHRRIRKVSLTSSSQSHFLRIKYSTNGGITQALSSSSVCHTKFP